MNGTTHKAENPAGSLTNYPSYSPTILGQQMIYAAWYTGEIDQDRVRGLPPQLNGNTSADAIKNTNRTYGSVRSNMDHALGRVRRNMHQLFTSLMYVQELRNAFASDRKSVV